MQPDHRVEGHQCRVRAKRLKEAVTVVPEGVHAVLLIDHGWRLSHVNLVG